MAMLKRVRWWFRYLRGWRRFDTPEAAIEWLSDGRCICGHDGLHRMFHLGACPEGRR